MIKPLKEFPLMARYKEVFPIDESTIIAYHDTIYCNSNLPDHLIVHENVHLEQQRKIGLERWVDKFLTDPNFRLIQELEAYRTQLKSVMNRELKNKVRIGSARALSSDLYGNLISFNEAFKLLK